MATVFSASLIVVLLPVLALAERIPMFSSFVNERKKGEFKSSMVLAVGMMAFSTTVCWGLFGDKYLVLASIYAWGVGDALAALIGKKYGKHKIKWKIADGKKSVEGLACDVYLRSCVGIYGFDCQRWHRYPDVPPHCRPVSACLHVHRAVRQEWT